MYGECCLIDLPKQQIGDVPDSLRLYLLACLLLVVDEYVEILSELLEAAGELLSG